MTGGEGSAMSERPVSVTTAVRELRHACAPQILDDRHDIASGGDDETAECVDFNALLQSAPKDEQPNCERTTDSERSGRVTMPRTIGAAVRCITSGPVPGSIFGSRPANDRRGPLSTGRRTGLPVLLL